WRPESRHFQSAQRLVRRERYGLADAAQTRVADRLYAASLAGGARAAGRAVGAVEAGRRADWIGLDPAHPSIAEHGSDT
ncbi:formimidoylglutamate deiminase, partial [Burkholderia pseudomallei]